MQTEDEQNPEHVVVIEHASPPTQGHDRPTIHRRPKYPVRRKFALGSPVVHVHDDVSIEAVNPA